MQSVWFDVTLCDVTTIVYLHDYFKQAEEWYFAALSQLVRNLSYKQTIFH